MGPPRDGRISVALNPFALLCTARRAPRTAVLPKAQHCRIRSTRNHRMRNTALRPPLSHSKHTQPQDAQRPVASEAHATTGCATPPSALLLGSGASGVRSVAAGNSNSFHDLRSATFCTAALTAATLLRIPTAAVGPSYFVARGSCARHRQISIRMAQPTSKDHGQQKRARLTSGCRIGPLQDRVAVLVPLREDHHLSFLLAQGRR